MGIVESISLCFAILPCAADDHKLGGREGSVDRGGGTGTAGTAAAEPMLNAQKNKTYQKCCLSQLITINK